MGSSDAMPYWHCNVPEDQRTAECPDFLRKLSEKDLGIISTLDSDYHISSWDEVRRIALSNRLELFQRVPSELRRYLGYISSLVKTYGSVANFIFQERLGWSQPITPRGVPFEYEDDIKILYNDWPYGIDPRIVHVVVWTKFELKSDPATGDLTDQARAEINDFVTRTFQSRVPGDRVIWFKNWPSLTSVHAVTHFHVMMFNPDPEFVCEVTNGDIPRSRMVT
ncbi:Fc.00g065580.m01.CDS01 [Cosmosporella sp. VM-42]